MPTPMYPAAREEPCLIGAGLPGSPEGLPTPVGSGCPSARCTPSGVMSKAQASTSATGRPRMASATTKVTVHPGSCRAGNAISAASTMTKATAP